MSLLRYILKLKTMDELIRKKATGNQEAFCKKVSMSRSLLNNYIKEMKTLGFPIEYDRKRNSYYYRENGHFVHNLFERKISDSESIMVRGGQRIDEELTSPRRYVTELSYYLSTK
jgi:biotin operon repressor